MDIKFNQNEDTNKMSLSDLKRKLATVYLGGGKAKIAKQHEQGKMTARGPICRARRMSFRWCSC